MVIGKLKEVGIFIILHCIKGYQDNQNNYEKLDIYGQLNVTVGRKAKLCLMKFLLEENEENLSNIYGKGWSC